MASRFPWLIVLILSTLLNPWPAAAQGIAAGASADPVYLAACPTPRPPVTISTTPLGDGKIQATITAGNGTLQLIKFGQMQNAHVTASGVSGDITSNQEIKPPAGATSWTFVLVSEPAVQSGQTPPRTTVPFTVFDGCGPTQPWSSFVGGGAPALQSTASITDAQVTEGNSGNSQLTFTVKLSVPSSQPISVNFSTADGTASSSSDYVAASGTVNFAPGETQKTVVVQVRGDFDPESDETFTVSLSNPVNGALGYTQATARIINDDTGPSASGDTYVATVGTPLNVAAPGVLSNDQAGTQSISVVKFGGLDAGGTVDSNNAGDTASLPGGGSLLVRADGSFSYNPSAGGPASFSFRYRTQSLSGQSEATVIIGVQTPPTAVDDPNYVANGATTLNVPEGTGVLANDTRGVPQGNVTSFGTSSPTSTSAGSTLDLGNGGSLSVQANGSFSFTAPSTVTGPLTFQYRLTNVAGSSDATVTVTVARGPVITTTAGTTAFAENASPVMIDTGVTISMPGGGNVTSATVVISNPQDGAAESLAASVPVGGITPSYNAGTHTLTLTGPASAADFQTALRGVTYENTSNGPNTTARTITFQGIGNAQTGNAATKSVSVSSVNDPPVLATFETGPLAFTEGDGPTPITASLTVNDLDDANLVGATVGITSGCQSGEDILALSPSPQNGISATYNSGTCTLTLTGSSSVANYQSALRAVQYSNSSQDPNTTSRTLGVQVTDGAIGSNTVSRGLTVAGINDLPIVTTSSGTTAFTEGGSAVVVDGSVTASDADDSTLASVTVTISNLLDAGQETLAANVSGTSITQNYNPGTGQLTLTGPDTLAAFIQVLQTVTYTNASNAPTTTDRTITFVANDGTANGNPATKTVTVASVNSAPVVTTTSGITAFTENGSAVVVDAGVTVVDGDNANLASATIVLTNVQDGAAESIDTNLSGLVGIVKSVSTGAGIYTLTLTGPGTVADYQTALQRVTYNNSSDQPTTTPDRIISFTVNDGAINSNTDTKSVSVAAVDDAPVAVNDAETVLEDSLNTSIDVLTNDTDVDGGTKQIISVTQPASGIVAITGGGSSLTYSPNPNYCNTPPGTTLDTFTYTLNGGSIGTVSMTATCINDAPFFAMGPDQGPVDNQSGAGAAVTYTVNNWATSITAGPGEGGQTLNFSLTTNNDGLFSTLPAVSSSGTLTYTPNTATSGSATVTVTLMDNGGTANSGVDTFAPTPNTFTIQTVFPAPDAVDDGPSADYTANGGIPIDIPNTVGVLVNDTLRGAVIDGYGAATGIEQTTVGSATATAQGGTVVLNADGSFRYTPPCSVPGGSDTFKYRLTNAGGSDTATVTITVNAGVCFVDSSAASGGDGSILKPFQNFTDVPSGRPVSGAIYILNGATGTYSGVSGITLKTGEFLLGQGVAASGNLPFTPSTRSDLTVLPAAGSTPTLNTSSGDLILLATNNTLKGFNAGNVGPGSTSITSTGISFGTLAISNVAISTNGRALNLDSGTVASGSITSVTSTGGANNVRLVSVSTSGSAFDLGGGSLSNAASDSLLISGGNGSFTYGGAINSNSAHSVNVTGKTGGIVTLSGAINDTDTGISLTGNTGATINFTGTLAINTGGNAGFTATGGGTVSSTSTDSTITTTTGTALNVANTTVGASGLTFRSIASNGAPSGIILNTTGTSGGLHVLGTGATANSGGIIQNTTGVGISLNNTSNVSFNGIRVANTGADGIKGTTVHGFSLTNSAIIGAGDGDEENGIIFSGATDGSQSLGVDGTVLIQDVTIDGSSNGTQWGLRLFNNLNNATLNMTIQRVTVQNNQDSGGWVFGEDGVSLEVWDGTANILVDDSDFLNTAGSGIHANAGDASPGEGALLNLTIQNSTFTNNHALPSGMSLTASGDATARYKVTGNTITGPTVSGVGSMGIDLDAAYNAHLDAIINNNTMNVTFGTGLEFIVNEAAIGRLSADGNTINLDPGNINASAQQGMNFQARGVTAGFQNGELHLNLTNNTINGITSGIFGFQGMNFQSGASNVSTPETITLNMTGNRVNGAAGLEAFSFRQRTGTTFEIQGLTPSSGATEAQIEAFIAANNNPGSNPNGQPTPGGQVSLNGNTIVAGASAPAPPNPGTSVAYTADTPQSPTTPTLP
ncbi:MAG: Ig-like domain-containing protein [Chloroflexota bacterium]